MDGDLARIELELDTNFYGPLRVTRAFAPILAANGGGTILNVLSVLSWLHLPSTGAYAAAKAAAWAMTDVARRELAPSGIHVAALHVAYVDTDMAAHINAPRPTRLTSRRWRWTASRTTSQRSSPTTPPGASSRASRPRPPLRPLSPPEREAIVVAPAPASASRPRPYQRPHGAVTRCEDVDLSEYTFRVDADRDRRARTRLGEHRHPHQHRRRQATGVTPEIYLVLLGHQGSHAVGADTTR